MSDYKLKDDYVAQVVMLTGERNRLRGENERLMKGFPLIATLIFTVGILSGLIFANILEVFK